MDENLLLHGREVARRLNWRVQMTIPSILAAGEMFSLRLTTFGPDSLPSGDWPGEIVFGGSSGIEGLPRSIRIPPESDGMIELDGLEAVGPDFAMVRARVEGSDVLSNPAWVVDEPPYRLYWGDLHIHTTYSNCCAWSCRDPEFAYAFARDATHLDFAAAADHLRGIAAEPGRWQRLKQLVKQYDDPGRFVPLLAFESSHKAGYGGDNNAYFFGAEGDYFWVDREDMRGAGPAIELERLWQFLTETGQEWITVPHHTGRAGKYRSFADAVYDPRREPLFEVYSAWGSSEMRNSDFPLHAGNTDQPAYFVDALRRGFRYGLIASSDDHTTLPGAESRNWGLSYGAQAISGYHRMGVAALRAEKLTRDAIWQAMKRRDTYGSTLARTVLDVRIGDLTMGRQGKISPADPLRKSRRIRVRASIADQNAADVVLIRNGLEIDRRGIQRGAAVAEVTFEDDSSLDEIAVREAPFHLEPFVVYYVRVQTDKRETQWTSPIWLDL